jgi:DNA-binding CsgD family transcriptional regulator
LERGEFATARDLFAAALDEKLSAEALDGLGQALWFLGEIDTGIARREEAYAAFRRAGHLEKAAEVALWLVVEHQTSLGNEAAAAGWFKRAERILADLPLCPSHAELEVHRGQRCGDPTDAVRHFERAVEIGRQLGDQESEVRGLNQLGFTKVTQGDVEEGMNLLDETMAAAMGGELRDPWAIGATCCSMLFACERIADLRRASDWCRVVLDFTERRRFVPLSALCRSVYAGILIESGGWARAEAELQAALKTYRGFGKPLAAYPLARLVDLRTRQGRLEEASQLTAGWEGHPEMAVVTIALLLERGESALARARLDRQLSRLGQDSPFAAPFFPLLVRLLLAEQDIEAAGRAADEFIRLAHGLGHDHLVALSELAVAQVESAASGEAAGARFESAIERFSRIGMPFEEARAHVELAKHVAAHEAELAISEARAGLELFERLGAAREADRAAGMLRTLGATGRRAPRREGDLTGREKEVLDLLEHGLSNKQIADRLYIAPKTASHHVSQILAKLGVGTRAEAAAFAARRRIEGSARK